MTESDSFDQGYTPTIVCVNQAKTPLGVDFAALVSALQFYVDQFVAPRWGTPAKLVIDTKPQPGCWLIVFLDDPDQAGALGYHDLTKDGLPLSKVFVKTTLADKAEVSVTASHELVEMLVDPAVNTLVIDTKGKTIRAYEACLAGDTRIALQDGTTPTIAELTESGGEFDVLSYSEGRTVSARAHSARLTNRNAELVKVYLSDGSSIKCTADHRILCEGGIYRSAGNLLPGDVLPCSALAYTADLAFADAESNCGLCCCLAAGKDGPDLRFGELCSPTLLASHPAVAGQSTFGLGIEHVFVVSADEEMGGIDAGPHIAAMADFLTFRDRSEVHLVGKSMGDEGFPFLADLPVAIARQRACPQPALFGFVYEGPESVGEGRAAGIIGGPAYVRASVDAQTLPMHRAEPFGANGSSAFGDRAFSPHFMLPLPMSGAKTLGPNDIAATFNGTCIHAVIVDRVEECGKGDVYDLTVPGLHNVMLANGVFVHNCDPVEETWFPVQGINVSNFVYPAFFEDFRKAGSVKFDEMGLVKKPLQLLKGGYQSVYKNGKWSEVFGSAAKAKRFAREDRRGHRSESRGKVLKRAVRK